MIEKEKSARGGSASGGKKLVLIDGNALIHRAFHALPPLTTKKGELVNAVYGFSSVLLKVINDLQPDYILASFDLAGPTFRHKEFEEYKATRVKAPDELYAQIGRVKEVVKAFNIPIFEKDGYEADDVIGTLVFQSENHGELIENIIVTGDLDTLQLVSPKTKVYALRKGMGDTVIYDEEAVQKRYGLSPSQVIDYKGLRGDQSDNIPGVKGVGEKTAAELLQKYQTLENVYAHLGEIKGSLKEKLERDKMQAFMSKKLASIVKNVPLQLDFSRAITHEFDRKKLVDLFQELNFFSLIKRIPGTGNSLSADSSREVASPEEGGVKDFKFEQIGADKIDEQVEIFKKQKELAMSLETVGSKYFDTAIHGISFCYKTGRAVFIEYSPANFEKLREVLENSRIKKIGYNLKYSLEVLKTLGINLNLGDFLLSNEELFSCDVMIAAYVLNPGGKVDFESLILEELGEEIEKESQSGQLGLAIESPEERAKKISRKADYIFKLKKIYAEKIEKISLEQNKKNNLKNVFLNLEMPLVEVLADMEMRGIKLNTLIFKGISEKIEKRIKNLEETIYGLAKTEFNINSPKQLAEILFEKLKISSENVKKNKTGYSTASSELSKIRKEHKIIEKIEEYREIFKLKTTYLDSLPLLVDKNSRIHTDFNQAVASTGRLSSSNPNMQNIPIRTDLGQILRTAFVAENGWKLVSADYSQIDLRVVAHVSQDKKMMETFFKNEDVHKATAAEINKVPLSQVTARMRRNAKALNFGVIYGMSVYGFSEGAGIEREEARKFIDAYMEKFSGIANYMRKTKETAKEKLYVETEMGRRRYIPEINSPNFQVANSGERMAINMPIQGLSADIMKLAMIKIYAEYKNNPDVKIVLQVHDEIILEVKEEMAKKVSQRVKEIMEKSYSLSIPLIADVKIGDSWGEI
jgi:DNA polymerase-1